MLNMKEVDFDPNTMTRATPGDIIRMYNQLWPCQKGLMDKIIENFAKDHPQGFMEKDLLNSLPAFDWYNATKTLYEMALVKRDVITFDLNSGMFHAVAQ